MKIALALAALTTALAQSVPVTIINQCATTVSPQFLGTGAFVYFLIRCMSP